MWGCYGAATGGRMMSGISPTNHMKTILSAALLLMAFALSAPAQSEKFNPNGGMFYITNDVKVPRALKTFTGFALITEDYKADGTVIKVKPSGELYEDEHHRLKLTNIVYDGKTLSFKTLVARGVKYEFTGRMLDGSEKDSNGNSLVLQGHLTKYVRGKKVAEIDAKYFFEEGD